MKVLFLCCSLLCTGHNTNTEVSMTHYYDTYTHIQCYLYNTHTHRQCVRPLNTKILAHQYRYKDAQDQTSGSGMNPALDSSAAPPRWPHNINIFTKHSHQLLQLIDLEHAVGNTWFVRMACFNVLRLTCTKHTLPTACSKSSETQLYL